MNQLEGSKIVDVRSAKTGTMRIGALCAMLALGSLAGTALAQDAGGEGGQGGQGGQRPRPFAWKGTATTGDKKVPARMFLMPPPRRPEGEQGGGETGQQADARRRGPRRPPGELRIGNKVFFIKPVNAEIDEAAAQGPKLRKLSAELVIKKDGKPQVIGKLEITVTPADDGATIAGTATVKGARSDEERTFTLDGTVMRRPRGGQQPADRSPGGDTAAAPAASSGSGTQAVQASGEISSATAGF